MLKEKLKGFVCGVLATILCFGVVYAQGRWKTIDVLKNDITVMVNGKKLEKENFLYNDTTYLPLRAVAEAVGKEVTYDAEENMAIIEDKVYQETNVEFSSDELPIYEIDDKKYVMYQRVLAKYSDKQFSISTDGNLVTPEMKVLIENVPYITQSDFIYIELEYYETVMLPVIQNL